MRRDVTCSGDTAAPRRQASTMPINRAAWLSGVMAAALLAAGCAGTLVKGTAQNGVRDPIAQLALSMVGVRYRYGGADPREGFDCSGLVYYAYTSNGQAVPRTSRSQYDAAHKITLAQASEGDLLFFRDRTKVSHVGIYLGEDRFVHAPSSGGSVRVDNIDEPYYQRHLVAVGRLLP
jgi:cell wall-associated NlpC family hydrolase